MGGRVLSGGLFFVAPLLVGAAALVMLPAITATYGAEGFASVAVAQSVGSAVGVVCELGWSVLGPQAVARSAREGRTVTTFYERSVATRAAALAIGVPLAAFLAWVLVTDFQAAAAAIAAGSALVALSPIWLLTGLNRPGLILWFEVLPRMLMSLGAALWILAGGPLFAVAIAVAMPPIAASIAAASITGSRVLPTRQAFRGGVQVLRGHGRLTVGRAITVAYTSLLTSLTAIVAPASVASFAAADKLLRMGLSITAAVPSRLQSWVGSAPPGLGRARSRRSLLVNLATGAIAAIAYGLLAIPASAILFSGTVTLTPPLVVITALTGFVVCASRGAGLSLVAEGRADWIAVGNVAAAAVGVSLVFGLAPRFGAAGAMTAALAAESSALLVQIFGLLWRRRIEERETPD